MDNNYIYPDGFNVRVGYSKTVFEEPYSSQNFNVELEVNYNNPVNIDIASTTKLLQKQAKDLVDSAINTHAPKAKSYEEIKRIQTGKPSLRE